MRSGIDRFVALQPAGVTGFAIVVVLWLSVSVNALAQSAARPDKGVRPTGSYAISDIENISMTNGNLNLSLPLASLPPIAGGKLSWTIGANYNSKMWEMYLVEEEDNSTVPATRYMANHLQLSGIQSWVIGGGYRLNVSESRQDVDWREPLCDFIEPRQYCDPDFQLLEQHSSWFKVSLTTPEGAVHELRPLDSGGDYPNITRDYLLRYSWKTPATTNTTMTYYSYDGSYLWASIEPWDPLVSGLSPRNWDVYMRDGTRIKNRGGNQWISDPNGNSIRIYTSTTGLETTTHFVDKQTLREIRYVHNQGVNPPMGQGRVEYQTVGGSWVSIFINFRATLVNGWAYEVGDPFCDKAELIFDTEIAMVDSIELPESEPAVARRFSFDYNSDVSVPANYQWRAGCGSPYQTVTSMSKGLGSLSRMTMPSGAVVKYSYLQDQPVTGSPITVPMNPTDLPGDAVIKKEVQHDGVTDAWNYSPCLQFGNSLMGAPDGSFVNEHSYPHGRAFQFTHGGLDGKGGLTYRTNQSDRVIIERKWRFNTLNGMAGGSTGSTQLVPFNPVVDLEFTTLMEPPGTPAKMSAKKFQYDLNGNVTSETDYDWFAPSLANPYRDAQGVPTEVPPGVQVLRVITNSYHNDATSQNSPNVYHKRVNGEPPTPLILNAVKETSAGDGAVTLSKTRFHYDEQGFNTPPINGNVTQERRDNGGVWIDVKHAYDLLGNRVSTTDPRGNITQFFYEDQVEAQPTRIVVDPNNQVIGDEHTTQIVYDYYTGLVTSQTDANGAFTETQYTNQLLGTMDPYGRPGVVIGPAVTSTVNGQQVVGQNQKVVTKYLDSARQLVVTTDLNQEGDGLLKSRTTADMLGRVILTEGSEDGTPNYTIRTRSAFERMGRITYGSNPTRDNGATTDGWSRTTRDDLGRVVEVATFGGPTKPTATATNWNGRVQTSYNAEQATVTDQAGKKRKSVADGLGRLAKVYEDPDVSNLETSYTYDALGNLTRVNQGSQVRQFTYDSLSRLRTAKNPEQVNAASQMVATVYTYDDASNLVTRTNPNGTTVGFTYDGLNRVMTKTLSVGGAFTYTYDAATNGKGRLTSVTSAGGNGYYYDSYDKAGKVTASHQVTTGPSAQQSYTMSYGYNLAGAKTTERYPSGKEYRTGYDNAGRVRQVSRYISSALDKTYASGFSYTAHGAVSSMSLSYISGSPKITEQTSYNSRLQSTKMDMRKGGTNELLLGLDYGYGTTANNGNMQTQAIRIGGTGTTATWTMNQTFTYDALNRLDLATEAGGWSQDLEYDRYGNRWVSGGIIVPGNEALTSQSQQAFTAATNRLSTSVYDTSGNQTQDGAGRSFTYDAENRQLTFNGTAATYAYDGDGRRVKKTDGTGTTVFVYNAAGQLVAEYSSGGAQPNGTSYLTTDHLGSTRLVTDASGAVKARHDYLPFGEEVPSSQGIRGSVSGYAASDGTRQRFTQKERDNESGLDYFLARYYSSAQGRFTGVDTGKFELINPQTLNKYRYGLNNPLRYIDPDGRQEKEAWYKPILDYLRTVLGDKASFNDHESRREAPRQPNQMGLSREQMVQEHFRAIVTASRINSEIITTLDPTGGSSVVKSFMEGNKSGTALSAAMILPNIFGVGKALTTGELLMGRLGGAHVAAQFSKKGSTLVADVVGVFGEKGGGSLASTTKSLFNAIMGYAKEEGLSKVKLQAVAVVNKDLEQKLVKQGWEVTTVVVDGEKVTAYTKTFQVR